jgi:hypothetical protein
MGFKQFFPFSLSVVPDDGKSLAVSLLIYFAAIICVRVVSIIFGWIVFVGAIVSVIATIVGLYCTIGILLSLLIYFKVV